MGVHSNVTQAVEWLVVTQKVEGSSPSVGAKFLLRDRN